MYLSKNPSQGPKPRSQVKNPSRSQVKIQNQKHKLYVLFVWLFVCLLAWLENSCVENDSLPWYWTHRGRTNAKYWYTKEYDESLPISMHAMRAGIYSTLASSPRSLTYNRDMFLNIPLIADWHAITQRQEQLINEHLIRENQKQCCYDYVPQQPILKKKWKPHKLGERTSWSYRVLQTHVNTDLRDQKCNRPNVVGKDKNYCCWRCVNILWACARYPI